MIRVKFMTGGLNGRGFLQWRRQLPDAGTIIGDCEFLLDINARDYDWLVVYDDLPRETGERFSHWCEVLPGPRSRSIVITREPSSIKLYGRDYLAQYGYVLTSQEPWAINHPGTIRSQPALRWFYGVGGETIKTLDAMRAETFPAKPLSIGTVCSDKQQGHTLHRARHAFTFRLKQDLPELDIFGHGVRPIGDKAEALDPYRYHLAIENHVAPHHWTEKLADAFLGWTVPFYHGAPDAADYFPADSFIPINIHDYEGSLAIIRRELAGGDALYARRQTAVTEARRRVLEDYNFFAVLAREITQRHPSTLTAARDGKAGTAPAQIIARHAIRKRPLAAVRYFFETLRARRHRG